MGLSDMLFPVHPRVCGELITLATFTEIISGSSPRVWGTPVQYPRIIVSVRFIPACVGNSLLQSGSSPRVWGTHYHCAGHRCSFRFIPACVGNSTQMACWWPVVPVHPRVCGELQESTNRIQESNGSSPRVWGTRLYDGGRHDYLRFIPACVGNSISFGDQYAGAAVHPRVCGELEHPGYIASINSGSSPRVWGTLYYVKYAVMRGRFIPACVGNS